MKQEPLLSLPWETDQFVTVELVQCCYELPSRKDVDPSDLLVHLPGLFSARISVLKRLGYRIDPPKKVRTTEYA